MTRSRDSQQQQKKKYREPAELCTWLCRQTIEKKLKKMKSGINAGPYERAIEIMEDESDGDTNCSWYIRNEPKDC